MVHTTSARIHGCGQGAPKGKTTTLGGWYRWYIWSPKLSWQWKSTIMLTGSSLKSIIRESPLDFSSLKASFYQVNSGHRRPALYGQMRVHLLSLHLWLFLLVALWSYIDRLLRSVTGWLLPVNFTMLNYIEVLEAGHKVDDTIVISNHSGHRSGD